MSRAVVMDAILADPTLSTMGFNADNVKANFAGEQRPSDKMFMSLNWGQHTIDRRINRGPRDLVVWIHMYRGFSTDYSHIDTAIIALDNALLDITDTPGADGYSVNQIEAGDKSRDLKDSGYDTLCRSVSYKVFSRKT